MSTSFHEFQAVILAAGNGRRLVGLTPSTPKALVTVANRPLLWYCLSSLQKEGFGEVLITVAERDWHEIRNNVCEIQSHTHVHPTAEATVHSSKPTVSGFRLKTEKLKSKYFSNMTIVLVQIPRQLPSLDMSDTLHPVTASDTPNNQSKDNTGGENNEVLAYDSGEDTSYGTAELLVLLSPLLKTDFFVISCDVVGHIDLAGMADLHRTGNAACTTLYIVPTNETPPQDCRNSKTQPSHPCVDPNDYTWVVIDEKQNQIVDMKQEIEITHGDPLSLDKFQLFWHPNVICRRNVTDVHVYLFRHSVLQLLSNPSLKIESITHDLIPILAKLQDTPQAAAWATSKMDCDVYDETLWDCCPWKHEDFPMSKVKKEGETEIYSALTAPAKQPKGTRVLAFIQDIDKAACIRVNTTEKHHELNLLFCSPQLEKFKTLIPNYMATPTGQSGLRDCVVGESLTVGTNAIIKRCVIGSNVTIESGVKLAGVVIGDDCTIMQGCKLQQCTISSNVVIEPNCQLSQCRVEKGVTIPETTDSKDEIFYITNRTLNLE